MNEIVVGVDGSDHSRMALRWAAAVADAAGVPVRAVQSWIHPRSAVLPIAPPPVSPEQMDDQTREAIAIIFMPENTIYDGKKHVCTDPLGLQVGQKLDHDMFPVVSD